MVSIEVEGAYSRIDGNFTREMIDAINEVTSYHKTGYEYSNRYRSGQWDGKIRLFRRYTRTFPSGLLNDVKGALKDVGVRFRIDDRREFPSIPQDSPPLELIGINFEYPYDFQLEVVQKALKAQRGVLHMATNCLAGSTIVEIHRAGKSFKTTLEKLYQKENRIEDPYPWRMDIPTKIRSMFEDGYIRLNNVLQVVYSGVKDLYKLTTRSGKSIVASKDHKFFIGNSWKPLKDLKVGDLVYIDGGRVRKEHKKRRYQSVGGMDFHPFSSIHRDRRPGRRDYFSVQKHRVIIEADLNGISFDEFVGRVRQGKVKDLKFIDPKVHHAHHKDGNVQNNSRENLELLTVEEHRRQHGLVDWKNVTARVIEDQIVSIEWRGLEGTYDICVENDHNFLANGIVVHNSGKTECACLIAQCLRIPTLFLVPGKELLYQTSDRFMKRLGLDNREVGLIGDGKWQVGSWITIATVASLHKKIKEKKCQDLLRQTQLLFSDECHGVGSDSYYEVMNSCNAYFRYGMSGTPLNRSDGADLRLLAATGPVICQIRNKFLIERGISSEVEVLMLKVNTPDNIHPKTPWADAYDMGIVENRWRNNAICVIANHFAEQGLQSVILVKHIAHGNDLEGRLWSVRKQSFVTHQFICGKESTYVRQKAIKDFSQGDLQVLIATSILDQGVDLANIQVLILAGGGESSIRTLQRVGRGIRKGTTGKLIVVDFADFQNRHLLKHSRRRLADYRNEECFDIRQISLKEFS